MGEDFFIEGDLPNAEDNFSKVEVMMEDFGDHNGYTEELRKEDAELIVRAPKMDEAIRDILETFEDSGVINVDWIRNRLLETL